MALRSTFNGLRQAASVTVWEAGEPENPFVVRRFCTPCLNGSERLIPRRVLARYVACDSDGLEWFVCEECCSKVPDGISYITVERWCDFHGLPRFNQVEFMRAALADGQRCIDELEAAAEG